MSAEGSLIPNVVQNGLCAGCGLCEAVADPGVIQMRISSEGYLRPQQKAPLSASQAHVLADACPGSHVEHAPAKDAAAPAYHPLWGPLVGVRAGHSLDAEIRRQGSSGGGISAVAAWLLESGQVDFIAQIAVSRDDPLRNDLQVSTTRADILAAAGSRYAPSAPLAGLRQLLERGQRFAFVGKPCDVAALRRYGLHDPRVGQLVVAMISFMCAGIPSLHGTHELLTKLGADRKQLKTFRYRGDGWPGMARAVQHDGKVFETDYNSSWGTVLNRHLQFRCKICPDGTGEFADIVCADAWYGKDGYPDFAERDGRSLILSRTAVGESLVTRAMAAGALAADTLPADDIARMQPYQVNRKQMVLGRVIATWLARRQAPRYRRMALLRNALNARKVEWLRNAWGTLRRAKGESL
jgi:coenzyme F420 hydrogenase subunit beta